LGILTAAALVSGAANAAPKKILVLGDSIAAGYGLAAEESFPARLEAALRARGVDAEIVNSGISGDTTAGGRKRLDWALASKPGYVIVELGGNDGLRGLDPKETRANLDVIIAELKAKGVKVMLAGMYAPPNLGTRYEAEFNAIFPELAAKHGIAFYPFILEGVAMRKELNQPDGIHPNARGVDVIVERLLPAVMKFIGAGEG
jgi:acyl-CoA thioesterase-1